MKTDFYEWMIIQTLLHCLPLLYQNIVSVRYSLVDYDSAFPWEVTMNKIIEVFCCA